MTTIVTDVTEHGTNASYHRGCRCDDCYAGMREYENRRRRLMAYGRWEPYVDAEPVREHVRHLMAPKVGSSAGVGWMRIADVAGVSRSTVDKLLYGDRARGGAPSKRCRRETARKLLAVGTWAMADGARVPSGPTRRLIRAMRESGFTGSEIARYVTGDVGARPLRIAPEVTLGRAEAVEALHARWQAGEIIPRGRWNPHECGPLSPFPGTPGPPRCETCGGKPWQGGRWCWDDYQANRRAGAA